ncbi:MAG: glycerol-3-phosphate dehydrogenase, partial [Aestuariivirga sp.]
MSTVTILGAGVMGSSMSLPACDRGHTVRLVGTHLDRDIVDSVAGTGRHPKLNVRLPDGIRAFHHEAFASALGTDTDLIVLGVSSAGIGWAIDRICDALTHPVPMVMITKGLHPEAAGLTALPDHVAREVKRRKGF